MGYVFMMALLSKVFHNAHVPMEFGELLIGTERYGPFFSSDPAWSSGQMDPGTCVDPCQGW